MNRISWLVALACATLAIGLSAGGANAQATRTWVSGVGDDANPCSRTAPCKTFAGAISKTAAGGEISVLDPGGFGAVNITKSITIGSSSPTEAGVLNAGTNGVIVNGAGINVVLKNLIINGGGTGGTNGIRFIQGASLTVLDSVILQQITGGAGNQNGILFAPGSAAELFVSNTRILQNGAGADGFGILVKPTAGGSATVSLRNVEVVNNRAGVRADATTTAAAAGVVMSIIDSTISGNTGAGVAAANAAGMGPATVTVRGSNLSHNQQAVLANGLATATVAVGSSIIAGNATAFQATASGIAQTYSNNQVNGNAALGTPTPIGLQ